MKIEILKYYIVHQLCSWLSREKEKNTYCLLNKGNSNFYKRLREFLSQDFGPIHTYVIKKTSEPASFDYKDPTSKIPICTPHLVAEPLPTSLKTF